MKANVGDRIIIRGRHTGQPIRACQVVEVHGGEGPYVVRWEEKRARELVLPRQRRHRRSHEGSGQALRPR